MNNVSTNVEIQCLGFSDSTKKKKVINSETPHSTRRRPKGELDFGCFCSSRASTSVQTPVSGILLEVSAAPHLTHPPGACGAGRLQRQTRSHARREAGQARLPRPRTRLPGTGEELPAAPHRARLPARLSAAGAAQAASCVRRSGSAGHTWLLSPRER